MAQKERKVLVLHDGGEIQFSFLSALRSPPARATAVSKLFITALSKPLLSNVNNNNRKRKSWASPGCQCSSVSMAVGLFIALDCGCVDKRPHTWQPLSVLDFSGDIIPLKGNLTGSNGSYTHRENIILRLRVFKGLRTQ